MPKSVRKIVTFPPSLHAELVEAAWRSRMAGGVCGWIRYACRLALAEERRTTQAHTSTPPTESRPPDPA